MKVVLGYSGSLDTRICIHWLRHFKGLKVITLSIELGQYEGIDSLSEQAIRSGAYSSEIRDLREVFIKEFVYEAIRCGATYRYGYFFSAALARALIARELVKVAEEEVCEYVAHGSRGFGNDKYRFENCIKALSPSLKILTPLEELNLKTPQEDIEYAREHNIPITEYRRGIMNIDKNLWGVSIQLGFLKDSFTPPPRETYILTSYPSEILQKEEEIVITYEEGIPVALDGKELKPVEFIETLNRLGGRHGIGRFEIVEDRISGVKSRELYESPAATIIHTAQNALSQLVLDEETLALENYLSHEQSKLIYQGKWFSDLRQAISLFFAITSKKKTGDVRIFLCNGTFQVIGRKSKFSLFK